MYWGNFAETAILNTFRGQTAAAPTSLWIGAFLSNPGEAGGGTEASYPGYERKAISFTAPADEASGTVITNTADIAFKEAAQTVGTITYYAVYDSQVGGNMWAYNKVEGTPLVVDSGVEPLIKAGNFRLESVGNFSRVMKARCLNLLRGVNLEGFSPHIALFNGNPESGGSELSGTNYARFPISYGAPAEQSNGKMQILNAQTSSNISGSAWGTWSYTAMMDAASGGVCVAYFPAATSQAVGPTWAFNISEDALAVLVD